MNPSSSQKLYLKIGAICIAGLLLFNLYLLGHHRTPIPIKYIEDQSSSAPTAPTPAQTQALASTPAPTQALASTPAPTPALAPTPAIAPAPVEHEQDIFNESIPIAQNDTKLLNIIRNKYLIPPSKEAYNLVDPTGDPSKNEGQNQYVLQILNNMTGGFFVECGAWDGEQLSTTLLLERDYGWTGFLAEPNTESFATLRTRNRKAWIANICLSTVPHPQLINFGEVHNQPALSSIQKYFKIIQDNTIEDINNIAISRKPCFPIFSVLTAIGVKTVDFFTLDIEGAEVDVLKTIPFDSIFIKIFSIEWNHVPEGKEELRRFVELKGYKLVKDINQGNARDYLFVHQNVTLPTSVQLATTA